MYKYLLDRTDKFAVMTWSERLIYFLILSIGLFFTISFTIWWFNPSHIPNNYSGIWHFFDFSLFLLLSYIIFYQIATEVFLWFCALTMSKVIQSTPQKNLKVAFLTAFVPGKEPYYVMEKTLRAIVSVNYQHDSWLLDEGDDEIAKEICKKYGANHYSRKGIPEYNLPRGSYQAKTKAGNYNSWFHTFAKNYDIVAQLDVDFVPKQDFLTKTLGFFKDPLVAFVGTPQIYGNKSDSWITKGAAEQAYGFYGAIQKGLFGKNMQLFIGANHVIRVSAHDHIGGYSGHIVEDHLTGMTFYAHKWKSVYVSEVLAEGEGPATWDAYFSQQMRWSYGLIDILFTQSFKLFKHMTFTHKLNYFLLQHYYFYGISQGLGIILMTLYFVFGIESTSMRLLSLIIFYVPLLLVQQIISLWLQRFNVDPKNESGFLFKGRILSLAAWPIYLMAFFKVIFRKKLSYKVTPKGSDQIKSTNFSLFIPHFILGSITFLGIIVSFYTKHQAPQLLFFAILNTVGMYFFVLIPIKDKLLNLRLKN